MIQSSTPVHRTSTHKQTQNQPETKLIPFKIIQSSTPTKPPYTTKPLTDTSQTNPNLHDFELNKGKEKEVMIYLTPEERRKRSTSLGRDRQTQAEISKPKPPPRRDRQAQATNQPPCR
jgi:hypothetical protein